MNLFLLRHASAGTRRSNPAVDSKRSLDKDGKKYCVQLASVLTSIDVQFDLIVSSPLKRCLQTASLVGTETGYESKILLSDALAPEATLAGAATVDPAAGTFHARLLVDPVSLGLVGGSTVDFVESLGGAAFKVENPNATAGCGCGSSFGI